MTDPEGLSCGEENKIENTSFKFSYVTYYRKNMQN